MTPAAIEIDNLSFTYPDGTRALDGLSLRIEEGRRVALLGPNGAGKSTLLLHLNGVHRGNGNVRIFGEPITDRNLRRIRQRVGLVFQNPDDQLFCPTVRDDVAFGPRNLGLPEPEVERRVEASLRAVGAPDVGGKSPFHLSIGQRKRAAIATVLAMDAAILVLDEPTSNLDPRGRREIARLLKGLGGTQIVATHDLDLARDLCDRVVVLHAGRVAAEGPPEGLLADEALLERYDLR
jgi:cobalt/nickel transport system ATP-binding protein